MAMMMMMMMMMIMDIIVGTTVPIVYLHLQSEPNGEFVNIDNRK